jgi:hypothetical protein
MSTTASNHIRGAIFAASLAGVAALALTAPAFADEYSESQTTTTYQAAPPPPPVAQTTTTTTTTSRANDGYYTEGYVADAPPPPPPPPAPGVTVGIPGIVGVHVGP